jgi:hypothetical protein
MLGFKLYVLGILIGSSGLATFELLLTRLSKPIDYMQAFRFLEAYLISAKLGSYWISLYVARNLGFRWICAAVLAERRFPTWLITGRLFDIPDSRFRRELHHAGGL